HPDYRRRPGRPLPAGWSGRIAAPPVGLRSGWRAGESVSTGRTDADSVCDGRRSRAPLPVAGCPAPGGGLFAGARGVPRPVLDRGARPVADRPAAWDTAPAATAPHLQRAVGPGRSLLHPRLRRSRDLHPAVATPNDRAPRPRPSRPTAVAVGLPAGDRRRHRA